MRYIHERPEWPAFRWDEAALSRPLAEVARRQGRLLGRMNALGFDLREQAGLRALTEDAVKSSAIEGEKLDAEEVRSSIARQLGLEIAGLKRSDRHIDGVVEMLIDATRNHAAPLTAERLFGWHSALFPDGRSGLLRIKTGVWRDDAKGPMQVVSGREGRRRVHFEAPPAKRVPREMKRFLAWFNSDERVDPLLKAGLAHLWFVTVHPFEDGNGRIARAVADMALARSEGCPERFYSMSSQIRAEREDYYAGLEATQKGSLDVTSWLLWFLGCLGRAIVEGETLLGRVLQKADFWDNHRQTAFNERQREVLNRLLDGFEGKLTSSKWAKLTKVSQDTAARDIAGLIDLGVLKKDEAGGRSTSYSLSHDRA